MTRDEILTAYEDLWRRAAMEDWYQQPGRRGLLSGNQDGACAVLCSYRLQQTIDAIKVAWLCPQCGEPSQYGRSIGHIARHLNDYHGWAWLDFANKFRDALAQGETS